MRRDSKHDDEIYDTFYEYDMYGNKVKETVALGWGASFTWGADQVSTQWKNDETTPEPLGYDRVFHTFPRFLDNQLQQRITFVFDPKWGRPLSVTDANGATTSNVYDVFGRVIKLIRPGDEDPPNNNNPTERYSYLDESPYRIKTERRKNASGGSGQYHTSWVIYDGLGREIQKQVDAVSNFVFTNTYYSNRGLKRRETVPHYITGATGAFDLSDWNSWYNQIANYPGTDYEYDALQRPTVMSVPGSGTSDPNKSQKKWSYAGWDSTLIDEKKHKKVQKRDGFGRLKTVEEYTGTDPSTSLYATTGYQYDVLNNLTGVTVRDASQAIMCDAGPITYDALSRKTEMTDPDMGTWKYGYDAGGNLTRQQDANGKVVKLSYDGLNRLRRKVYRKMVAEVEQYEGNWVDDPLDTSRMVGVFDIAELRAAANANLVAANQTPTVWSGLAGENDLSNRTFIAGLTTVRAQHLTELRAAARTLLANQSLEFAAGDIVAGSRKISVRDPQDLRTWIGDNYEGMNAQAARVYFRYDTYSDGALGWSYGTGRRTEMWDPSGHTFWKYDQRGRVIEEHRYIDGKVYVTQSTYDAMDRVISMTYPGAGAEVVTYTYNNQLLLSGMSGSVGPTNYITGTAFNALSKPDSVTFGNGKATSYEYWRGMVAGERPYGALKRLWAPALTGPPALPALHDLNYTYDDVGNIIQVNDSVRSDTNDYIYDDLDRLLQRQLTGGPGESFTYNEIGNMLTASGVAYTYHATKKHAVVGLSTGDSFAYDLNGNMTARSVGGVQVNLKYDAENRLVKASFVSGGTEVYVARFAYDGDGKRVKRVDNYGTIHYVGPHYERNVGNGQDTAEVISKFYYAQLGPYRRLIAVRKSGELFYIHSDHLGGTYVVSDASGGQAGAELYHSFGETRTETWAETGTFPTDKKFTGQTLDTSTGLYFYVSRYYDSHIGRFTQPDTIVPRPADPQSFNRYSYTLNNPLRYVDPTGGPPWEFDPGPPPPPPDFNNDSLYIGGGSGGGYTTPVGPPVSVPPAGGGGSAGHAAMGVPVPWAAVRRILGDLVFQIGNQEFNADVELYSLVGRLLSALFNLDPVAILRRGVRGPDGTWIVYGGVMPGTGGMTLGNVILLPEDARADTASNRALLMHEYVHVLQYRALGISFLEEYARGGFYNWENNPWEQQGMDIQKIYEDNPSLLSIWDFGIV